MSSRPVDLFRRSWLRVLLAVSLLFAGLAGIGALQRYQSPDNYLYNTSFFAEWQHWSQSLAVSWILSLMVALMLPWLLLSFYGEWLYTRALPRQQLFAMIRSEYLKWWLPGLVGLLGLTWASRNASTFTSGYDLPWDLSLFAASLSLFGSLILASNPAILRRMALPAAVVVAWLILVPDLRGIHPFAGVAINWALCIGLLLRAYSLVSNQTQDLMLDRPGDADDENKSLERLGLFRQLGAAHASLKRYQGFGSVMARARLLTEHSRMLYTQLLMLLGGLSLLFSLMQVRHALTLWQQEQASEAQFTVLACLGICWAVLALVNPRFLISRRWEFLATRPIDPRRAYLANWGLQGLILALVAGLGLAGLAIVPDWLALANLGHAAALLLFLWIGGELALAAMVLLAGLSVTMSPALLIGMLAVLHSRDWVALLLWAAVLAWRAWDLLRFGRSWEPARTPMQGLRRQLLHYAPPLALVLGLSWAGVQAQPLPRFLNQPGDESISPDTRIELGAQVLLALYTQLPADNSDGWSSKSGFAYLLDQLRALIKAPRSKIAALDMGQRMLQRAQSGFDPAGQDFWRADVSYYNLEDPYWLYKRQELRLTGYWLAAGRKGDRLKELFLAAQNAEINQRFTDALELLHQVRALQPQARFDFYEGHLLRQLLRYDAARAKYLALAKRYPEHAADALLQAGYTSWTAGQNRRAIKDYLAALAVDPNSHVINSLDLIDYFGNGLCDELPAVVSAIEAAGKKATTMRTKLAFCRAKGPQEPPRPQGTEMLELRARWLMATGQPLKAVELLRSPDRWYYDGLQAQALMQAGRKDEALKLARSRAWAWQRRIGYSYLSINPYFTDRQYPVQLVRLMLEPRPGYETGLHVLMRSQNPDQDWPLISSRFVDQPELLARLTKVREQLRTLDRAYQAAGLTDAWHYRSLERTRVEVMLADQLPAELKTAEVLAVVRELDALIPPL